MSYAQSQADIESYFDANWLFTQIAWRNVKFDPKGLTEWVKLTTRSNESFQASMGADVNVYRYEGTLIVQLFGELNKGSGRLAELTDRVCDLFRSKRIGNITFRVPQVIDVGTQDGWYQINVICDFYRDELS